MDDKSEQYIKVCNDVDALKIKYDSIIAENTKLRNQVQMNQDQSKIFDYTINELKRLKYQKKSLLIFGCPYAKFF